MRLAVAALSVLVLACAARDALACSAGPTVPPPPIAMNAVTTGALGAATVEHVARTHEDALRVCRSVANVTRGSASITWTIDDGTVRTASLVRSSFGSARFDGCVMREVENWRFPVAARTSVAFDLAL